MNAMGAIDEGFEILLNCCDQLRQISSKRHVTMEISRIVSECQAELEGLAHKEKKEEQDREAALTSAEKHIEQPQKNSSKPKIYKMNDKKRKESVAIKRRR